MAVEVAALVQRIGVDHCREMGILGAEHRGIEFAGLVVDELRKLEHRARIGHLPLAVVMHPAALDELVVDTAEVRARVLALGVDEDLDLEAGDLFHHHFKEALGLGFDLGEIGARLADDAGGLAVLHEDAVDERRNEHRFLLDIAGDFAVDLARERNRDFVEGEVKLVHDVPS